VKSKQFIDRLRHQTPFFAICVVPLSACQLASPALAQADAGEDGAVARSAPDDSNLPQVDPVITDEEFKAAIPNLEADSNAALMVPLAPLKELEPQVDDRGDASESRSSGVSRELQQETQPDDPELLRPLPSIDEFVNLSPASTEQRPASNAEISYRTELLGLKDADRETPASLRSHFDELSVLRRGDGKAANVATLAARLGADAELLRSILASNGWFSPVISTRVERIVPEDGGTLTASIRVEPGKRYHLARIEVDAQPTEPPGLVAGKLALRAGEPVVADRILAAEANVSVALPRSGYPFAKVGERDVALDADTGEAFYTLSVDTGPRSRFGDVATAGKQAFDARHIEVISRFRRGALYDSRKVDDLRKALFATGLFSAVSVEPRPTGKPAGDGTEYVTIFVDQQAGPPRSVAGSLGYGAGEGYRLEASWTHRNMFPPEGALIFTGTAGTSEQGLGVTFRRSNAGKRDRTLELTANVLHSAFDAYSAYTGKIAGRISRDSTPIWQKRVTHSFGFELMTSGERDFDFERGARHRQTYYIAGLSATAGFDTTADLLDPKSGCRLTALIQPEGSLQGDFHPYVRARIEGSAYLSLGDGLVAAGRVSLGSIQGSKRAQIAPSRRFYAGGGGSVRGYGYQKLGPLDPNGDPIGGRSFGEASAELRYRFGDYGLAAFVDAGQSYAAALPRFSNLRLGVGAGFRYYTNFGPIRVDVATPIDRRLGENRLNVYVSIGQAF